LSTRFLSLRDATIFPVEASHTSNQAIKNTQKRVIYSFVFALFFFLGIPLMKSSQPPVTNRFLPLEIAAIVFDWVYSPCGFEMLLIAVPLIKSTTIEEQREK